mgnify:CR=1 FL=1
MGRRKFTREFKISAVRLVNEQGYSPAAAAKSLGENVVLDPDFSPWLGVGVIT